MQSASVAVVVTSVVPEPPDSVRQHPAGMISTQLSMVGETVGDRVVGRSVGEQEGAGLVRAIATSHDIGNAAKKRGAGIGHEHDSTPQCRVRVLEQGNKAFAF